MHDSMAAQLNCGSLRTASNFFAQEITLAAASKVLLGKKLDSRPNITLRSFHIRWKEPG